MLFGPGKPVVGKASIVIVEPVADVFRFIADDFFENYPRWSTEVVELKCLSDGPVQTGTQAMQIRVDYGRRSESTFRIVEFESNRRITFSGIGRGDDAPRSSAFRCAYDVTDARMSQPSTRLSFTFEVPELELFMRPFEKLIRVAVQEGADRTVQNLKRLIERSAVSKGGPDRGFRHQRI
jgi:uncharacterized protein YndB with AHSA1/START domain